MEKRLSDVARELNLDEDQLRYFDRLGVLVPRRVGALRMYDAKAIAKVRKIKKLLKQGFRPSEVRVFLTAESMKPSRPTTTVLDERMRQAKRGDVIRESFGLSSYNTTYVRVKRSAKKFGKTVQISTSKDGKSIEARIGTKRK